MLEKITPKARKTQGEARRKARTSKDAPRDAQGTQKATKNQQGIPMNAKRVFKRFEGTPQGCPKDAQSQPKASGRPPQGTLETTFGPQGNRNAKTLKTTIFPRSLLERFRGQVRMQSAHVCAIQTPKMTIYSSCAFEQLFEQTLELHLESWRGHPGPHTEEWGPTVGFPPLAWVCLNKSMGRCESAPIFCIFS